MDRMRNRGAPTPLLQAELEPDPARFRPDLAFPHLEHARRLECALGEQRALDRCSALLGEARQLGVGHDHAGARSGGQGLDRGILAERLRFGAGGPLWRRGRFRYRRFGAGLLADQC